MERGTDHVKAVYERHPAGRVGADDDDASQASASQDRETEAGKDTQTKMQRGKRMSGYTIRAVLENPGHPESERLTADFPISREAYEDTLERLGALEIGDVLAQDCQIAALDSHYTILKRLEGAAVHVDELDYLAKRLESFCTGEDAQFQSMACRLEISDIRDFINLTFCCQQATVITDFSNLEQIGRQHQLTLHGGALAMDEYWAIDGEKEALSLIRNAKGTVTPYGVAYDNGMRLEQFYQGGCFPPYLHESWAAVLEAEFPQGECILSLPAPEEQLRRTLLRTGAPAESIRLRLGMSELPETAADIIGPERLALAELPHLNRLCRAVEPMKDREREKLNAVCLLAKPQSLEALCKLAEHLDEFVFVPNVQTSEEYGRHMIRESGRFEYDENLEDFYDYRLYGEQRLRMEGGAFNECGYTAYLGTVPLEELLTGQQEKTLAENKTDDWMMRGF